jgi:hypothetical protein
MAGVTSIALASGFGPCRAVAARCLISASTRSPVWPVLELPRFRDAPWLGRERPRCRRVIGRIRRRPVRVRWCLRGEQVTPPARACSTPREHRGTRPSLPLPARPRSVLSCGCTRCKVGRSLAGTWTCRRQSPSGPRTTGHVCPAVVHRRSAR